MATPEIVQQLQEQIDLIKSYDFDKISRKNLGVESIYESLFPIYENILEILEFAKIYAHRVSNSHVSSYVSISKNISTQIFEFLKLDNSAYLQQKNTFSSQLNKQLEQLSSGFSNYVSAAVIEKGILENKELHKASKDLIDELKTKSHELSEDFQKQANILIEKTKAEVKDAADRIRLTASGVSISEAQRQFKKAQIENYIQIAIWSIISIITMYYFFSYITEYIIESKSLPNNWTWQLAVYAGLRATFLGAIASLATYCLKILKAQLHILQINSHRIRLANSMEAFAQVGQNNEQRGMIIMRLLDPIVDFGGSGLIPSDGDGMSTAKLSIDAINKKSSE